MADTITKPPGLILAVSSHESALAPLAVQASAAGLDFRVITTADDAMAVSRISAPDIVLIDLEMIDCRHASADKEVPGELTLYRQLKYHVNGSVAFMICLVNRNEQDSRFMGFDGLADEVLSVPLIVSEAMLRLRTALRSRRLWHELTHARERLAEIESLHDRMVRSVVHELRSPLQGIMIILEMIHDTARQSHLEETASDTKECMRMTMLMNEMLGTFLDFHRLQSASMPVELCQCELSDVIEECIRRIPLHGASARGGDSPELTVTWDPLLMSRAIANLVAYALKSAPGSPVRVSTKVHDDAVTIWIDLSPPGVIQELHDGDFVEYASLGPAEGKAHQVGLGLHFSKEVAEAHGGTFGLIANQAPGSQFWMKVPITAE